MLTYCSLLEEKGKAYHVLVLIVVFHPMYVTWYDNFDKYKIIYAYPFYP